MRLLTDQDVYGLTVDFLLALGHDVVTAAQLGLSRAADIELLETAHADQRIFLTRDRDFGAIVFVHGNGPGVIYLRMSIATMASVHDELATVLSMYAETELQQSFVVVEPGRHRIRRFAPPQP